MATYKKKSAPTRRKARVVKGRKKSFTKRKRPTRKSKRGGVKQKLSPWRPAVVDRIRNEENEYVPESERKSKRGGGGKEKKRPPPILLSGDTPGANALSLPPPGGAIMPGSQLTGLDSPQLHRHQQREHAELMNKRLLELGAQQKQLPPSP